MSLFAEGSFSAPATDDSSHIASSSSTPPTTVADSASLHSDTSKHDVITVADHVAAPAVPAVTAEDVPSPRRARRARASLPIYNLSRLSGTSAHGWRRSKGDAVADRRRRTISGDSLLRSIEDSAADDPTGSASHPRATIDALDLPRSPDHPNTPRPSRPCRNLRSSSRLSRPAVAATTATAAAVSPLALARTLTTSTTTTTTTTTTISSAASSKSRNKSKSKSNRKSLDDDLSQLPRELRRLQDTKEFAHIDDVPVIHTVWSNGKFVDPNEPAAVESPSRNKTKVETPDKEPKEEDAPEPITQTKQPIIKKYLTKGLYAGQEYPSDATRCLSAAEKKELAHYPELKPSARVNKVMPLPIFTGLRLLLKGRDFKLPYNVCNPLPPGQPKPDEWKKMTRNRFIGESKDIWRKTPHLHDYQSKCVCSIEDGCGESCQNRIMLYECDETNCNVDKAHCTNRAFADLTARRAKGGKYRVGVEVIKTSDRGYGVRSNRCFAPHQIIMEYTGEIITEEECERRMNEIYKDNECYYLMSFDQNMIIDATTGSIARFVNHSCNPNCRMIKWIVSGQPRMALFAGDRPIMTGDELTYDYNFDPFSAKNVQKCLCGQPNCRGVLGPRPREPKGAKTDKKQPKKVVKVAVPVKDGKRKHADEEEGSKANKPKKRKVVASSAKPVSLGLKAAKSSKKGVSAVAVSKKRDKTTSVATMRSVAGSVSKTSSSSRRILKTYGSGGRVKKTLASITARRDERAKTKYAKNEPSVRETSASPRKSVAVRAFEVD